MGFTSGTSTSTSTRSRITATGAGLDSALDGPGAAEAVDPVGLGGRPRAALLTLGLLSAFGPIALDLYLPALPQIGLDLSASPGSTQLTLSAALIGLAAGQLVAGPLSDRIGRRTPLLAGLLGFALMSVVCALAPTITVLVAARVVQGMCGAAGLVIARAVVRDAYPDHRIAEVFSLLMLINGVAPVAAPLIGGALLHAMPWRGLFWVLAAVGVSIGSLVTAALPETLPSAGRHDGGLASTVAAARAVVADRVFRGATAVLALASCTLFIYISLSSFVLQSQYHLSASRFSLVFAVNSLGIVIAGGLSSVLARRVSHPTLVRVGLVVMMTGSLGIVLGATESGGLAVVLPSLFVCIGAVGVVFPNAITIAMLRHGRRAGVASALLGATQYIAGAVAGPAVAAIQLSATTMAIGMTVTTFAALLTSVFGLRGTTKQRAAAVDSQPPRDTQ